MTKQSVKYFFIRFKRVLIASLVCVLAIAIISIVAIKTTQNANVKKDGTVQVSTPTAVTFIMPIKEGVITKEFSNTALKYNKTLKQWEAHKAVDIKGADKADVVAVYGGKVEKVDNTYLKGNIVTISHTNGLKTEYSSLDNVTVKAGDTVKQGDKIGTASTTAKSESAEGDHLHLEVYLNNQKVDPLLYLVTGDK